MAKIYADLVEAGRRSLDGANGIIQVPAKYIKGAIAELQSRGYFER